MTTEGWASSRRVPIGKAGEVFVDVTVELLIIVAAVLECLVKKHRGGKKGKKELTRKK